MADLQGRKVFKVFNQDFIVDERYNVTKELGQGAYGIVWSVIPPLKHESLAPQDAGWSSSSRLLDQSVREFPSYPLTLTLKCGYQ